MIKVVLVALPVPISQLYSYKVNSEQELIGCRVLVQFGSRIMTGVVVDYDDNIEALELKEIIEILDSAPFYSNKMLQFTKFVSEYYMSSWGETLRVASPPGISSDSTTYININNNYSSLDYKELRRSAPKSFELFESFVIFKTNRISINSIKKNYKQTSLYSLLENLERRGFITVESTINTNSRVKKIKTLFIEPILIKSDDYFHELLKKTEERSVSQARLLSYIYIHQKENEPVYQDIAIIESKCSKEDLQQLRNRKILRTKFIESIDINDSSSNVLSYKNELYFDLNEEQLSAVHCIEQSIIDNVHCTYLLRGVTGSGKTLVYLNLIKDLLEQNKSVLVLVPEISLTPQLLDRFKISFGSAVALIHSKMSDSDRIITWRQIASGRKSIVIGARSAVFAPMVNLGLIIVDEEHDASFKQENPSPRYNARDIAVTRAKIENCPIVLGSATPSLESYYNASINKYKLLELNYRNENAKLPKINILDMSEAHKNKSIEGSVSQYLLDLIEDRIMKKEGVIIYQNRRGFSPILRCNSCGYVFECPNCSIKLTHHKNKNILKCHFCNFTLKYPDQCIKCNNTELESIGAGTQRVEDELSKYFNRKKIGVTIERMDFDTANKINNQRKILERFYSGKIDILVGTQMVTKGLNMDRVTLVGVINADLQLYLPDFRANEKSFQILTQVSGRAGRKAGLEGQVVIQTYSPYNYSIQSVFKNEFNEFYDKELEIRLNTNYPPFSRLIVLEFYGPEEDKVSYYASTFRKLLPEYSEESLENRVDIYGPFTPSIYKQMGNYRRMVIIKSNKKYDKSGLITRSMLKKALNTFSLSFSPSTVMLRIDIDSQQSM